ncbi:MAG: alanyl-tRNA editing protein [Candidatus Aenigmarchaeota archaeon]|nr:alanyl-tRNA editing protein [Candidatus Aenigmarchaeota archaeon]
MLEVLYLKDCYLKNWKAKVVKADKKFIVLDQTAFYPNGGGQPWDEGTIKKDGEEFKVVFAGKFSGNISHEVDKEGLKEGDEVECELNWDRRYLFMRYHTAAHVLSEVIHKETGARITGNQMAEDKSRIDFNLENFDREKMKGFEEKVNEIIKKELPVKLYFLSKEDALKDPNLFSLKDMMPPEAKEWRIVEIEGFDKKACGGTHLKNISEIGEIEIIDLKNKGKDRRRVYFKLK